MQLRLTFLRGVIRGSGLDLIGPFTIDGHYEVREGRCWWVKRYVGAHDVSYSGHNEGKGIWGVWEISRTYSGGFHIWPIGMDDPTRASVGEQTEHLLPVEVVARSGRAVAT
jgi:hypothetical protein